MTNKERMSQIGEIMDEFVKLGFRTFMNNPFSMHGNGLLIIFNAIWIEIREDSETGELLDDSVTIDSPTWQQDLLAKVRELINV